MTILHINAISGKKSSGISVVVPEHVKNQSKLENVAMFNCVDYIPENSINGYKVFLSHEFKQFDILKLEKPFNKPDLVVFHGIYIPYYIKIYKNLVKHDIPYIILPHGSLTKNAQKIKRIKKFFANNIFFNKFIKSAKYIQYLSKMEKNDSSKYKVQSIVLGNGIYVPDNKLKIVYLDEKKIKFVYIGRLDIYHKGLDILLESIHLVRKQFKKIDIKFDIYGPFNGEEKKLEEYVKKYEIDNIVEIHDSIYDEEKKRVLLESDVFIQTSRLEGQPLGIMEAMAYGIPCIVTEGTSFENIINDNKCGYSSKCDAKEVAKNIIKIIQNKEKLNDFSKNAYTYAINNFRWDLVAKETIEKYNEIKGDL